MNRPIIPGKRSAAPSIIALVATGTVALVVGAVVGSAATDQAVPDIVTEVETVESVPTSCVEALDAAQTIFGYQAEFMDLSQQSTLVSADAVSAAVEWDVAGIEDATARTADITEQMDAINERVAAVDFLGPNDQCRTAAAGK